MRLLSIFFLFCVSVETVSPLLGINIQWQPWITSFLTDSIDKLENNICSYLVQSPDRAVMAINKIKDTLQNNDETIETFVSTINYLNSPDNQEKLTSDTSTCRTFFNELEYAIKTDFQNENISLANVQETTLNKLKNLLDDVKKSLK